MRQHPCGVRAIELRHLVELTRLEEFNPLRIKLANSWLALPLNSASSDIENCPDQTLFAKDINVSLSLHPGGGRRGRSVPERRNLPSHAGRLTLWRWLRGSTLFQVLPLFGDGLSRAFGGTGSAF